MNIGCVICWAWRRERGDLSDICSCHGSNSHSHFSCILGFVNNSAVGESAEKICLDELIQMHASC
jgi:hypothetical protein